jgi:hypothetical protein
MKEEAFISQIESYLADKLKVVSDYVYAGTLPSTLPTTLKKGQYGFVVVDCATAIYDLDAYSRGMVNIFMYAQPTSSGRKNVNALYQLEKSYESFLADSDNDFYSITESYRTTDYDSTYGLHYIISAINLIVK